MRTNHFEDLQPVARAETREELEELVRRETVESYTDTVDREFFHESDCIAGASTPQSGYKYNKVFRKGGPLEWYNPPNSFSESYVNIGTLEDWLEQTKKRWVEKVEIIPLVSSFNVLVCEFCGKTNSVSMQADPYESDLNSDNSLYAICNECTVARNEEL
jgi:hypothetical protein